MWDFFSTSDWTQTTWMRWGFAVLIGVVGYTGHRIVEELMAIRLSLQAIYDKLPKG